MSNDPGSELAALQVEAVLDVVLTSAGRLLQGVGGSIMLLVGPEELEVVCAPGNDAALGARVRFGEGVSGQVAERCEGVLVSGRAGNRKNPVDSGMCVPLLHDGRIFGVLNVNARAGHSFSDFDLKAATRFAIRAADTLAAARLYEMERRQGGDAPESHLATMLGHLNDAAGIDFVEPQPLEVVDVAELAREIASEVDAAGRPTGVRGPTEVYVTGRRDWLDRALRELVDNGHLHGGPPVRVIFEADEDGIVMSVADSGPGVEPSDRERIFEPFGRLDAAAERPGLGLGLTIAKRLIEACGGTLSVVDTPVGGAAVRIELLGVDAG